MPPPASQPDGVADCSITAGSSEMPTETLQFLRAVVASSSDFVHGQHYEGSGGGNSTDSRADNNSTSDADIIEERNGRTHIYTDSGTSDNNIEAVQPFTCGISAVATSTVDTTARTLVLHALQVFRGTPYRDNEKRVSTLLCVRCYRKYNTYFKLMVNSKYLIVYTFLLYRTVLHIMCIVVCAQSYIHFAAGSQHVVSFPVQEGVTLELTLARFWSPLEDTRCSVTPYFRGVRPSPSCLTSTGGQRVGDMIRVENALGDNTTDDNPYGKLEKWVAVLKPTAPGKVSPLGERDILPEGSPLYQLVFQYEFDQADSGEIIPRWPGLQGALYESNFLAQFFLVFDSKKKLIGTGDAWPSAIKIGKGRHVVRCTIASKAQLHSNARELV